MTPFSPMISTWVRTPGRPSAIPRPSIIPAPLTGGGYTVSGLNVSGAEFAGLFGYVKGAAAQNAELKNMVVQGSVDGQYAGGIVGRADYVAIQNCGNEAAVTGSGYAGGVVGQKFNYSSTLTIDGCYNTAAVSGDRSDRRHSWQCKRKCRCPVLLQYGQRHRQGTPVMRAVSGPPPVPSVEPRNTAITQERSLESTPALFCRIAAALLTVSILGDEITGAAGYPQDLRRAEKPHRRPERATPTRRVEERLFYERRLPRAGLGRRPRAAPAEPAAR